MAKAVVVGAGVGGLACAAELAARGIDVTVLERAATPGGKLREVEIGGRQLDAGPTVFTMRWVFDELFAACGASLDTALPLRPLQTLARHAWSDAERLDLHANLAQSVDAISAFAGAAEGRRYRDFCARAADIFRTLDRPFMRSPRPTPVSLAARVGWRGLPGLLRISPFDTLASALGNCFTDPRLIQLFGRYATYCGSSPYLAPATLMLVAHVEKEGVWSVPGGMKRIAEALAGLVTDAGGRVRYGAEVAEVVVEHGRACGVRLRGAGPGSVDGEFVGADAVVFNGDVAALGAGLLGAAAGRAVDALPPARRSLSALTWNTVTRCDGFPLLRHNVFFARDYAAEFADLFGHGRLPADPTVYVCAQDRDDEGAGSETAAGARAGADPSAGIHAAKNHAGADERLLCLVNAPARGDSAPLDAKEIERCRHRMTTLLARCGLTMEPDPTRTVTTTPSDFANLFPGSGGALYGQASHGWAASFSRPGARSRLPGLYLAGGTVHPGPGVPMAALSGRQAAASILADRPSAHASTRPSRPAATPGGMSMR